MEPYNEDAAVKYNKLSSNENWLRKRQSLALPALPSTTPEACKYFFFKIRHFADLASKNGHGKINYEAFSQEWNQSADGIVRFYVTAEVLSAYAKSWKKASNINVSQELIKGKIDDIQQTRNVLAATLQPFPTFLTAAPVSIHPCQGVVDIMEVPSANIPASISTELAISHPAPQIPSMCVPILTQGLPLITNPHICPSPEIYWEFHHLNQVPNLFLNLSVDFNLLQTCVHHEVASPFSPFYLSSTSFLLNMPFPCTINMLTMPYLPRCINMLSIYIN